MDELNPADNQSEEVFYSNFVGYDEESDRDDAVLFLSLWKKFHVNHMDKDGYRLTSEDMVEKRLAIGTEGSKFLRFKYRYTYAMELGFIKSDAK